MRFEIIALTVGNLVGFSMAHMELVNPAPRRSRFSSTYTQKGDVDYDMSTPLGHRFPFPCRGIPAGPSVATYSAGESLNVTLGGMAVHNGGHCQFALSVDGGKNFVVLKTVMGNCLVDGLNYQVPFPTEVPNGDAVFAWTWINKTGNREYYMNCADITIKGGKGTSLSGPKLLVVNMENTPTIPEFSNGSDDGSELMNKRPIVTTYRSGESSEAAAEGGAGAGADSEPEPEFDVKKEIYKKKSKGRKDKTKFRAKTISSKKPNDKDTEQVDPEVSGIENKELESNSGIKNQTSIKSEKSEPAKVQENEQPVTDIDIKKKPSDTKSEKSGPEVSPDSKESHAKNKSPTADSDMAFENKVPTYSDVKYKDNAAKPEKTEPVTIPANRVPTSNPDGKYRDTTVKPETTEPVMIPGKKMPASNSEAKYKDTTVKPVKVSESKMPATGPDTLEKAAAAVPEVIAKNKEPVSESDGKDKVAGTKLEKSEPEAMPGNKVEPSPEVKKEQVENTVKESTCTTQCLENGKFQLCVHGHLYNMRCAPGTQCSYTNGEIHCDY